MKRKILKCSFCKKTDREVGLLIAADKGTPRAAKICNECVAVCVNILAGHVDLRRDGAK